MQEPCYIRVMSPDDLPNLAELHALIAFYTEAGVDAVLDEQPVDRFTAVAPLPRTGRVGRRDGAGTRCQARRERPPLQRQGNAPSRPAPPSANLAAPLAPDAAIMAARERARSAASLEELRAVLERFEGCALRLTRDATGIRRR